MKKGWVAWLGILMSLPVFASAGKIYTFKQISVREGLSQNTVRSLLVDRRGFVWAGTLDGLNRYDGKHFLTYKPRPGQPASLSDSRINALYEDMHGYLWIRKYDNTFSCYQPETESFLQLKKDGKVLPLSYKHYLETRDSAIWLWGAGQGCIRITRQPDGQLTTGFYAPDLFTHRDVQFLSEDSQGNVWAGCHSGLNRIAPDLSVRRFSGGSNRYSFRKAIETQGLIYFLTDSGHLLVYQLSTGTFTDTLRCHTGLSDGALLNDGRLLLLTRGKGLLAFNPARKCFEDSPFPASIRGQIQMQTDRRGGIWVYNHSGTVWYYNRQTGNISTLELIPPEIASVIDFERYNIFIDSRNIHWITTYGNGLFAYQPATGQLHHYKYTTGTNSPSSDYLLCITEDAASNLWVGTEYGGMFKVIRENYGIRFIRPQPALSVGKSNNIKVIFEDSGEKVWVGARNGGLYLYDKELKNGTCLSENINPYTIAEDSAGRIWVGTKGNGIYLFDRHTCRQTGHLRHDLRDPASLSHNSVFQITTDRQHRIWIVTFGGGLNLAETTPSSIRFRHFFRNEGNRSKLRCILPDSQGMLWLGSYDGLIRFDPAALLRDPAAYSLYRSDLSTPRSLGSNDIKCLLEDRRGRIWAGTAGGGLSLFRPDTARGEGQFITYTTRQGLAGDIISALLETEDEKLWIGSENGLTRLDRKRQSFMAFHFAERTYGNHFNENAACLRRNGQTLWGTLDGILVFDPALFTENRYVPPVLFTDFYLYDEKVVPGEEGSPLKKSVSNTSRIDLSSAQNTFTIGFATLNLTEPLRNRYSYILEPYDRRWSRVSNNNQITYKNMPPGRYVFSVRGSNGDGRWNTRVSRLEIVIHPPFWKSPLACFLYSLLALLLLYTVFRLVLKFNHLRNTLQIEKQLTDYKLRFFTNISHEFRTPLTLIRGVVENLSEQAGLPAPLKRQVNLLDRNTAQLSRLIDQLLEFRKIQNNVLTLNLEKTDMIRFAREIYHAFSEMALRKQIRYLFSPCCETLELCIDRGKVDKILFNLLSNAFKFTPPGGQIELSIETGDNPPVCILRIKDNGIGIPKEKQHLLFSRFMQVNFSSAGTGVGLSLVKEFTEVHKGKVWYEPNLPQGSVFCLSLPGTEAAYAGENFIQPAAVPLPEPAPVPEPASALTTPLSPAANSRAGKVLIIDDNPDIVDFLEEELQKHYQTETAANGKDGLAKAIDQNPDLIICDVMMPGMDGFELTRQLKNEFQTCHIPVVLLTAHSSSEHQLEGIECGADAYITKPFSLKYLLSRVNQLTGQRERLKKRFAVSPFSEENLPGTTDKDKAFYDRINCILDEQLGNPAFSVDEFSERAGLKRTVFYKKIKSLTGFSPNELIKIKRMKKAAELLASGNFTVAETAWQVGIEDPFYFSKCFKAQFGCSPSRYPQKTD